MIEITKNEPSRKREYVTPPDFIVVDKDAKLGMRVLNNERVVFLGEENMTGQINMYGFKDQGCFMTIEALISFVEAYKRSKST